MAKQALIRLGLQLLALCVLLPLAPTNVLQLEAVSLGQSSKLTREQLLELDREVSDFYRESYTQLDDKLNITASANKGQSTRSVSYEDQLLRSLRALRHTIVSNHFDYKYTSKEIKWASMGAKVDKNLCKRQLRQLVKIAKKSSETGLDRAPLSIIDFIESSGSTSAGILNGNFAWLGSYSSCVRAKISPLAMQNYIGTSDVNGSDTAIQGRYCVVHLRAKSWPKWDDYFEDRLTIKRGLCLPDSCHSAIIEENGEAELALLTAHLALFNLLPPFNDNARFEMQDLYCLPDEDSPYRQPDLGAKLFFFFLTAWALLTVYTNIRYHQRASALKQLREAVDIKMIINERCDGPNRSRSCSGSSGCSGGGGGGGGKDSNSLKSGAKETDEKVKRTCDEMERAAEKLRAAVEEELAQQNSPKATNTEGRHRNDAKNFEDLRRRLASSCKKSQLRAELLVASASAASSLSATPLPSGLEDECLSDTPYKLLQPFGQRRKKRTKSGKRAPAPTNFKYETTCNARPSACSDNAEFVCEDSTLSSGRCRKDEDAIDFVRAFSLEENLKFLLKPRSPAEPEQASSDSGSSSISSRKHSSIMRTREQLAEATTKRSLTSPNVTIVSTGNNLDGKTQSTSGGQATKGGGSRVSVDILDGLKVIATCYIIWGHTMMFFFGCVNDLRFGSERMFDLTMIGTINTLQVVGLFYITTGCLLTYFSFSRAKPKQLLNPVFWLLVVVGRYVRLIPAYALVFWFARHVAPYTGYGHDWYDYRTDEEHPRGACAHESWWTMWTMSAADVKIPMDCIPQAWYLSDDFRTLLVLPVYVFLLARNALLGYASILATFAYSTLRLVRILQEANIDYQQLLLWQPHVYALMTDRLHSVYTDSAVRMSTYLLGVCVGHLLYLYEKRFIKQWPNWFLKAGFKLALGLGTCIFFGATILASPLVHQFLPRREHFDSSTIVWLIPLFKTTMELAICFVILLTVTGHGFKFIRALLSSQLMKILSNISYMVFLIHVELMYKMPAQQFESNYWILLLYASFFIIISHLAAFFLHLVFEMPIHNLTRHLFKWAFSAIS